jgi:hypothetical protein
MEQVAIHKQMFGAKLMIIEEKNYHIVLSVNLTKCPSSGYKTGCLNRTDVTIKRNRLAGFRSRLSGISLENLLTGRNSIWI